MTQPPTHHEIEGRRKSLRRTVAILVSVVLAFFLLSFVQIVMMK